MLCIGCGGGRIAADTSGVTKTPRQKASVSDRSETSARRFLFGVNLAHVHRRGHGYGSVVSRKVKVRLKQMGFNAVAITPFGYQSSATADEIFGYGDVKGKTEFFSGTDPTMTDEDIIREAKDAHELGLVVVLKPQIWSRDFWGGVEWHGTIRQKTRAAHRRWWESYRSFVLAEARLARRAEVEWLVIGTELVKMTEGDARRWRNLAREIRKVYPGRLTYAAHWDGEFERIGFWEVLDGIGVNAYFPLEAPDTASVPDLVRAWRPYQERLRKVSEEYGKPVLFLEIGYQANRACWRRPWEYEIDDESEGDQAKAYEAFFRAFKGERFFAGFFLWKAFTDPRDRQARGRGKFRFLGTRAEEIIRMYGKAG
ncbi:MAG: hypothetical protein D6679_10490 [Candidatus Hydrogenedentota bacterium]|nr:MAG: hypothetical protein D6679_10490 [Candidatus Hydrogenedentota bacterium]